MADLGVRDVRDFVFDYGMSSCRIATTSLCADGSQVRIVYRLAEFANGGTSAPTVLSTQEAFFYVFEALPMFSALMIWNIWHPGRFLVGPESLFPKKVKISRKEKKALKEEKKATQQRESRKSRRERRSRSRRAEYAAPEVATAERPWIDEELQYTSHPRDPY